MPPLLDVRNLTVKFPQSRVGRAFLPANPSDPQAAFFAVRDLGFSINPGEVLGLVGESGSGKSVTALAIMGLLPPAAIVSGAIRLQDGDANATNLLDLPPESMRHIRGRRIAMIFQEPMTALNPAMRVGDQIAEAVLAHNLPPPEIAQQMRNQSLGESSQLSNDWYRPIPRWFQASAIAYFFFARILRPAQSHSIWLRHPARTRPEKAYALAIQALRDVAIPEPERRARSYPHQLSGGMRQRVMIAMAIVNRPQLLIADEPTTALDVTIQQQILDLLNELRHKFSLAMLFISHDLAVVSHVVDRVAVMYAGSLVELAPKSRIFTTAAHPYTQALLRAIPTLSTDRKQPLAAIEGTVPPISALPPGCPFEPRCPYRIPACAAEVPPQVEVAPGHLARCPVMNSTPKT